MKQIILFSLIFFLNSCTLLRMLNTSPEKDENTQEINTFLSKHPRFLYDYSFDSVDSASSILLYPKYRINKLDKKFSYLELRIYNSSGQLYSAYSQCFGDFNEKRFLDSFPPRKSSFPYLNYDLTFDSEIDIINADLATKKQITEAVKKFKYTYVVYWTIWTNYYSKHLLKEVAKQKNAAPNEICVILVNTAANPKQVD